MNRAPITLLSLLSPMALLVWSSSAMAVPPGPCPGPVFIEAFDGAPAIVCPRPKAHLDYFASYATSFATLGVSPGPSITWKLTSNGSPVAPSTVSFGTVANAFFQDGDFDGDGKTDIAIYDKSVNSYRYLPSSTGGPEVVILWGNGTTDFIGAEGDYDCDGKTDPTTVRDVAGTFQWLIQTSGPGTDRTINFGTVSSDIPLDGMDWDGDGCDDLGTIQIGGGGALTFRIGNATTGALLLQQAWGNFNTDFVVPGDFIGDERADFAVWRGFGTGTSGEWMIKENGGPGTLIQVFGTPGSGSVRDTALRGDFDGDGKDDLAVKKFGTATWQWRGSSDGVIDQRSVGLPGDIPAPSFGVQ